MARARAERTKSKAALIEDLSLGIERLQAFLPQIEDLGRDGFPYLEGARTRTELQLRECIRKTFGDKSPEYQHYRQHKLSMDSPTNTKKSVALIKNLIGSLEDKKLELQGLKPPPPPEPPAPPPTPKPQMTLVPPVAPTTSAIPTAQVTITSVAPVQPPPVTMSVALSTNLDLAAAPQPVAPPTAPAPATPTPVAAAPVAPAQVAPPIVPIAPIAPVTPIAPPVAAQPTPPPPVASPVPILDPVVMKPEAPPMPAAPSVHDQTPPPVKPIAKAPATMKPVHPVETTAHAAAAPTTESASSPAPEPVAAAPVHGDPTEVVKSICRRFHMVARQLRLRGEYRATLDVEDEFDVQDLLHALLRLHFDDIETDEWVPSYSGGSPRIMFLLNDGRLAIVVKKTRTGLNAKDLGEQLRIDVDHCRTLKRCSTLLCFVYDPEGRIGNPRGLEADLICISDQLTADVFVAPK